MLSMCNYGLHASIRAIDALKYAPGPVICRVRLGGTIIEDTDKCVASRRTVIWIADAERELRLFACWTVRNTPLGDGRMVWDLLTDKRSQTAIEVAELYADGLATDDELDAAADAAAYAARAAYGAYTAADAAAAAADAAAADAAAAAARAAYTAAAYTAYTAYTATDAHAASQATQNTHLEQVLSTLGGE
jgi:hypothetical protein